MGPLMASMGLLGLDSLYLVFGGGPDTVQAIHVFGMGASRVALFSHVGGGLFTRRVDLVGKVETGIPEDDPRNPGVIADNVGDNGGDRQGLCDRRCGVRDDPRDPPPVP